MTARILNIWDWLVLFKSWPVPYIDVWCADPSEKTHPSRLASLRTFSFLEWFPIIRGHQTLSDPMNWAVRDVWTCIMYAVYAPCMLMLNESTNYMFAHILQYFACCVHTSAMQKCLSNPLGRITFEKVYVPCLDPSLSNQASKRLRNKFTKIYAHISVGIMWLHPVFHPRRSSQSQSLL